MTITASPTTIIVTIALSVFFGEVAHRWAQLVAGECESWLRERRHAKLERMVVAELLARGCDISSVQLRQLSFDVPPRVTPAVVKRVANQCERLFRMQTRDPETPPHAE